jgi:autophagy-related protein 27
VCAIKTTWEEGKNDTADMARWVAIAGDFGMKSGLSLDVRPTRLKTSSSNADKAREGVRLELLEGRDPFNPAKDATPVKQKAIVEMLCDRGGEGATEGAAGAGLSYVSYELEDVRTVKWKVLRLEWRTKYACEDAAGSAAGSKSWGFFTWIILM